MLKLDETLPSTISNRSQTNRNDPSLGAEIYINPNKTGLHILRIPRETEIRLYKKKWRENWPND